MDPMEPGRSALLIDSCPPRYKSEFPTNPPVSLLSRDLRHRTDDSYYSIYPTLLLHGSRETSFSNESSRGGLT